MLQHILTRAELYNYIVHKQYYDIYLTKAKAYRKGGNSALAKSYLQYAELTRKELLKIVKNAKHIKYKEYYG